MNASPSLSADDLGAFSDELIAGQHEHGKIAQKLKEPDVEKWGGVCPFNFSGMTNSISFHVPGAVVGKGRPRIGKAGGFSRMFTPEKTVNYETLVKWHASHAMKQDGPMSDVTQNVVLLDGPVQVNLLIGVQIPASWSKKKQAKALAGEIYPTSKPDLDNSIKSVFDAMNGVVYRDDAQVVTTVTKKRYRAAPGLWVTVFEVATAHPQKD